MNTRLPIRIGVLAWNRRFREAQSGRPASLGTRGRHARDEFQL